MKGHTTSSTFESTSAVLIIYHYSSENSSDSDSYSTTYSSKANQIEPTTERIVTISNAKISKTKKPISTLAEKSVKLSSRVSHKTRVRPMRPSPTFDTLRREERISDESGGDSSRIAS